jgi:hypothetical protein
MKKMRAYKAVGLAARTGRSLFSGMKAAREYSTLIRKLACREKFPVGLAVATRILLLTAMADYSLRMVTWTN